jgi:hypothetical protein
MKTKTNKGSVENQVSSVGRRSAWGVVRLAVGRMKLLLAAAVVMAWALAGCAPAAPPLLPAPLQSSRAAGDTNFTNLVTSGSVTVGNGLAVLAGPVTLPDGSLALSALADAALTVCAAGCDYDSVADAVAAASAGETVLVAAGIYTETETILIAGDLQLVGVGHPLIRGAPETTVLQVTGGTVRLENVSIEGIEDDAHAIVIDDGAVTLVQVTALGGSMLNWQGASGHAVDLLGGTLSVHHSRLTGGAGEMGIGLRAAGSAVATVYASVLRGGEEGENASGSALTAANTAVVTVHASRLEAPDGEDLVFMANSTARARIWHSLLVYDTAVAKEAVFGVGGSCTVTVALSATNGNAATNCTNEVASPGNVVDGGVR